MLQKSTLAIYGIFIIKKRIYWLSILFRVLLRWLFVGGIYLILHTFLSSRSILFYINDVKALLNPIEKFFRSENRLKRIFSSILQRSWLIRGEDFGRAVVREWYGRGCRVTMASKLLVIKNEEEREQTIIKAAAREQANDVATRTSPRWKFAWIMHFCAAPPSHSARMPFSASLQRIYFAKRGDQH